MDGLFYRDLLSDGGFFHPLKYAMEYYQHYPAIAPVMYPPFFGFVQIIGFSMIGQYPWVARLTVILFLGWGAWGLKRLTEVLLGKRGAFYAGLIYMSIPIVIYWSRDVMLETPAMALIIWSFYYFLSYLKHGKTKYMIFFFIFATLCPYTKQNTFFIFPVFLTTATGSKNLHRMLNRRFLTGTLFMAICGIPLMYVTFKWGILNINQAFGELKTTSLSLSEHLFFHLKHLPESVGLPLLIIGSTGIYFFIQKKEILRDKNLSPDVWLFLSWIILCYLQIVLIKIKEPRHSFFWMPVFAILAAAGMEWLISKISQTGWKTGTAIILCIFTFNLMNCKMNWSSGFSEPVKYITDNWEGNGALIDVVGDASLVFHLRAIDSERRFRFYRSSKIFESVMIFKEWGVTSFIKNENELTGALSQYNIRYILLEEPINSPTQVESLLRKAVKSEDFKKINNFHVVYPDYQSKKLYLYRYMGKTSLPGMIPDIHLPVTGITISGNL